MDSCPVNVFRLEKQGLERVLGSLEARIMDTVWNFDRPVTVGEVQRSLQGERCLTFNTVMTVMNRLVEKGLLIKEGGAGPYVYVSANDRNEFINGMARGVAAGLVRDFGDCAVSQFLAVLIDENPKALNELEQLIRKARHGREGEK